MADVSSKELYKFKKTLKELSEKKGRGTELVSVYIPHDKQLSDVGKQMRDELGPVSYTHLIQTSRCKTSRRCSSQRTCTSIASY